MTFRSYFCKEKLIFRFSRTRELCLILKGVFAEETRLSDLSALWITFHSKLMLLTLVSLFSLKIFYVELSWRCKLSSLSCKDASDLTLLRNDNVQYVYSKFSTSIEGSLQLHSLLKLLEFFNNLFTEDLYFTSTFSLIWIKLHA